jgi:uncharacterized protein YjeT (DUF2065 family)
MTWSHRYIGNPILSALVRLMFSTNIGDSHSGLRAFSREAYQRLGMRSPGMEFASEMVINAARIGLKTTEVPITYYPRDGSSKLRTLRDGWRHLRYMLLRSPTHLFLIPGLCLLIAGLVLLIPFLWGPVVIGGRPFDIHAMFLVGLSALVGYQLLTLGYYARFQAVRDGLDIDDTPLAFLRRRFSLERGLVIGLLFLLAGGVAAGLAGWKWLASDFGELSLADTRLAFFGFISIVLGLQTIFSSFYLLCVIGLHADETPVTSRRDQS